MYHRHFSQTVGDYCRNRCTYQIAYDYPRSGELDG